MLGQADGVQHRSSPRACKKMPTVLAPFARAGGGGGGGGGDGAAAAAAVAAAPAPHVQGSSRLRRLGSALSSAWGSNSSLLRHSSLTNYEPTGASTCCCCGSAVARTGTAALSCPALTCCSRPCTACLPSRPPGCLPRPLALPPNRAPARPLSHPPTCRQVAVGLLHVGVRRWRALPAVPARRRRQTRVAGRAPGAVGRLWRHPSFGHLPRQAARAPGATAQPLPRAGAGRVRCVPCRRGRGRRHRLCLELSSAPCPEPEALHCPPLPIPPHPHLPALLQARALAACWCCPSR